MLRAWRNRGVAKNGGFRGGISCCHPLPAVTDVGKNYVQMRMEAKKKKRSSPQISGVFGRTMVSQHGFTKAPPPSNATVKESSPD